MDVPRTVINSLSAPRAQVASVIRVDGASMQPTLNPRGAEGRDWVLVEKWSVKLLHRPRRGDVVVLW